MDNAESTRYIQILVAGREIPRIVVRVTGTIEERFTQESRWEPSDLLSRVPDEPLWSTHEYSAWSAEGLPERLAKEVLNARKTSELAEVTYYAVRHDKVREPGIDGAFALIRRTDRRSEEKYDGYHLWSWTDLIGQWNTDRVTDYSYFPVSPEEAERLRQRLDRETAENWRHHAVTEHGRLRAVVRVGVGPDRQGWEMYFTGYEWWHTKAWGEAPDPSRQTEEIDYQRAVELMPELVQRNRAELTGGYALFHQPSDVIDLENAYQVVQELRPEHRIFLPLEEREAKALAGQILVRNAKRQAAPVDGYHYFAYFALDADMHDLGKVMSVIRAPLAETRPYEVFLREGEWPPTRQRHWPHTLPLDEEGIEQATRVIAAAKTRYFMVSLAGQEGTELVRLTGTTEETSHDLGWLPSNRIEHWRETPRLLVSEYDKGTLDLHRFYDAKFARAKALEGNEYEYLAFFEELAEAFDFGNAYLLVRRKDNVSEEFLRPDGWTRTDRARQLDQRGSQPEWQLPITEEEIRGLTA
ncbi:hypothetical protein [Crossiella cryophila]|uniref:Uncharacterized protein n=1 Tax=Crossiella cryophila TaxID=43355 RepID=A0A7W7CCB8_9PSEU|nr:hypothetical protein [Crossiella cryophila]MBB4678508.1 hypothetical protein [Crossiella cryophila]